MQGVTLGSYTWEDPETSQFPTTSRQGQAIGGVTQWEELPWEVSCTGRSYTLGRAAHWRCYALGRFTN